LIDVREPHEHAAGAIPQSQNIPLGLLSNALDAIPKDKPVLLYCKSGARSGGAQQYLSDLGYDAHNIGGYETYAHCQ
jgi:phage shock protein E